MTTRARPRTMIMLPLALLVMQPRVLPAQIEPAQRQQDAAVLASIEQQVKAVHERIASAIVRISYGKSDFPMGSGVIATAEGHVVTSSGVVRGAVDDDLLTIRLPDGRRLQATALGWSGEWAIGLLKITEAGPWPHVTLGDGTEIKAGQPCVAMGYQDLPNLASDRAPAMRLGKVTESAIPAWLTSSCAFLSGGYSVFDLQGRLLGVTSNSFSEHSLHTNVEMLRTHWDELAAGKNLDRERLLRPPTEGEDVFPLSLSKQEPPGEQQQGREAAALERAKSATVRIGQEQVSGVIVTADGYVITCGHHQGLPGKRVTISLQDGRDASAVVLGTNRVSEVGLMKITDKGPWPYARWGDSTIMKTGAGCVLVGYPTSQPGRQPWVRESRIIQPTQTMPARDEWSCRLWTSGFPRSISGASGGGLFDLQGRVVGILLGGSMSSTEEEGEMTHSRVELFRQQWDMLAKAKPGGIAAADPIAKMAAAFGRMAEDLAPIVVRVRVDRKQQALGTIVSSDGRILTKASGLQGAVSCRLADGRVLPASVLKVATEHDLALIKIDATDLPAARWNQQDEITPGMLIAGLAPGKPPRIGVVSLAARQIPSVTGGLGATLRDDDRGCQVHTVARRYAVPLRPGDIVVHVQDQPTPDLAAYRALVESGAVAANAGDPIRVGVRRRGKSLEFQYPRPPAEFLRRRYGKRSGLRWWGFPSAAGTDMQLWPTQCGGPVIDIRGNVLGIAIACPTMSGRLGQRHFIPARLARTIAD